MAKKNGLLASLRRAIPPRIDRPAAVVLAALYALAFPVGCFFLVWTAARHGVLSGRFLGGYIPLALFYSFPFAWLSYLALQRLSDPIARTVAGIVLIHAPVLALVLAIVVLVREWSS